MVTNKYIGINWVKLLNKKNMSYESSEYACLNMRMLGKTP